MTVRQQWLVVATVVAVVGAGVAAAAYVFRAEFVPVTVGSHAPDFDAVTLDSVPARRTFADYAGRVTLVNVWATWCAPCEKEMPELQRIYAEYKDRGLRLAAVSVDSPGMEPEIRKFAQRFGLTFDILYDSRQAIMRAYMMTGQPETFIIGKDGIIRFHQIGPIDQDAAQVRALVTQLLAEPGS